MLDGLRFTWRSCVKIPTCTGHGQCDVTDFCCTSDDILIAILLWEIWLVVMASLRAMFDG